jgi:hypothetical protein
MGGIGRKEENLALSYWVVNNLLTVVNLDDHHDHIGVGHVEDLLGPDGRLEERPVVFDPLLEIDC